MNMLFQFTFALPSKDLDIILWDRLGPFQLTTFLL